MNKFTITSLLILLASCSNQSVKPEKGVNQMPLSVSDGESDYVVKERNPEIIPEWIKDFSKWKKDNEGKGESYFLGESGDVNDRISGCDYAALIAKKKIAQQQAELVTSRLAANKQGRLAIDPTNTNDPGLQRAFEDQLAGKSIGFLSGVKEYGTFWELRDYSKSNGNKRVFNCSTVVTISDKDLKKIAQQNKKNSEDIVEDIEAKKAVKEALKDIDKEFANYKP